MKPVDPAVDADGYFSSSPWVHVADSSWEDRILLHEYIVQSGQMSVLSAENKRAGNRKAKKSMVLCFFLYGIMLEYSNTAGEGLLYVCSDRFCSSKGFQQQQRAHGQSSH